MKVLNLKILMKQTLHSTNYFIYRVKQFISPWNFIAIEKYSIEWDDVKDDVAEQIEEFVNNGGTIITVDENKTKNNRNCLWVRLLKSCCIKICSK
jgi:hypothetical protein